MQFNTFWRDFFVKTKCSNLTVCKDLLILRSHSAWVHGSKIQKNVQKSEIAGPELFQKLKSTFFKKIFEYFFLSNPYLIVLFLSFYNMLRHHSTLLMGTYGQKFKVA